MKNFLISRLLAVLFVFTLAGSAWAQYDDLYYNPDTDEEYYESSNSNSYDDEYEEEYGYDDDEYEHYEEDNYRYSSRIRRFHRPYRGFGYFSSCYIDRFYYDPFMPGFFQPGVSIYTGFGSYYDYRQWRRWQRFNRWNNWNSPYAMGYNPYFRNDFYAYNPYYTSGVCYGPNGGYYNAYNNNYGGNYYNQNDYASVVNNTHYGPRTNGSTRVGKESRRNHRYNAPSTGGSVYPGTPNSGGAVAPAGSKRINARPARDMGGDRVTRPVRKPTEEASSPQKPRRVPEAKPSRKDRERSYDKPQRRERTKERPSRRSRSYDKPQRRERTKEKPSRSSSRSYDSGGSSRSSSKSHNRGSSNRSSSKSSSRSSSRSRRGN